MPTIFHLPPVNWSSFYMISSLFVRYLTIPSENSRHLHAAHWEPLCYRRADRIGFCCNVLSLHIIAATQSIADLRYEISEKLSLPRAYPAVAALFMCHLLPSSTSFSNKHQLSSVTNIDSGFKYLWNGTIRDHTCCVQNCGTVSNIGCVLNNKSWLLALSSWSEEFMLVISIISISGQTSSVILLYNCWSFSLRSILPDARISTSHSLYHLAFSYMRHASNLTCSLRCILLGT